MPPKWNALDIVQKAGWQARGPRKSGSPGARSRRTRQQPAQRPLDGREIRLQGTGPGNGELVDRPQACTEIDSGPWTKTYQFFGHEKQYVYIYISSYGLWYLIVVGLPQLQLVAVLSTGCFHG